MKCTDLDLLDVGDRFLVLEEQRLALEVQVKKMSEQVNMRKSARAQEKQFLDRLSDSRVKNLVNENERAKKRNAELMRLCEDLTAVIDGHTRGVPYRVPGAGIYSAGTSSRRALNKSWEKFVDVAQKTYPHVLSRENARRLQKQIQSADEKLTQKCRSLGTGGIIEVKHNTDIKHIDEQTWNSKFIWQADAKAPEDDYINNSTNIVTKGPGPQLRLSQNLQGIQQSNNNNSKVRSRSSNAIRRPSSNVVQGPGPSRQSKNLRQSAATGQTQNQFDENDDESVASGLFEDLVAGIKNTQLEENQETANRFVQRTAKAAASAYRGGSVGRGPMFYPQKNTPRDLLSRGTISGSVNRGGSVSTNQQQRDLQNNLNMMNTADNYQNDYDDRQTVQALTNKNRPDSGNIVPSQSNYIGTTREHVPPVGSAAYEAYSKLRSYELEMQSDMRLLSQVAGAAGLPQYDQIEGFNNYISNADNGSGYAGSNKLANNELSTSKGILAELQNLMVTASQGPGKTVNDSKVKVQQFLSKISEYVVAAQNGSGTDAESAQVQEQTATLAQVLISNPENPHAKSLMKSMSDFSKYNQQEDLTLSNLNSALSQIAAATAKSNRANWLKQGGDPNNISQGSAARLPINQSQQSDNIMASQKYKSQSDSHSSNPFSVSSIKKGESVSMISFHASEDNHKGPLLGTNYNGSNLILKSSVTDGNLGLDGLDLPGISDERPIVSPTQAALNELFNEVGGGLGSGRNSNQNAPNASSFNMENNNDLNNINNYTPIQKEPHHLRETAQNVGPAVNVTRSHHHDPPTSSLVVNTDGSSAASGASAQQSVPLAGSKVIAQAEENQGQNLKKDPVDIEKAIDQLSSDSSSFQISNKYESRDKTSDQIGNNSHSNLSDSHSQAQTSRAKAQLGQASENSVNRSTSKESKHSSDSKSRIIHEEMIQDFEQPINTSSSSGKSNTFSSHNTSGACSGGSEINQKLLDMFDKKDNKTSTSQQQQQNFNQNFNLKNMPHANESDSNSSLFINNKVNATVDKSIVDKTVTDQSRSVQKVGVIEDSSDSSLDHVKSKGPSDPEANVGNNPSTSMISIQQIQAADDSNVNTSENRVVSSPTPANKSGFTTSSSSDDKLFEGKVYGGSANKQSNNNMSNKSFASVDDALNNKESQVLSNTSLVPGQSHLTFSDAKDIKGSGNDMNSVDKSSLNYSHSSMVTGDNEESKSQSGHKIRSVSELSDDVSPSPQKLQKSQLDAKLIAPPALSSMTTHNLNQSSGDNVRVGISQDTGLFNSKDYTRKMELLQQAKEVVDNGGSLSNVTDKYESEVPGQNHYEVHDMNPLAFENFDSSPSPEKKKSSSKSHSYVDSSTSPQIKENHHVVTKKKLQLQQSATTVNVAGDRAQVPVIGVDLETSEEKSRVVSEVEVKPQNTPASGKKDNDMQIQTSSGKKRSINDMVGILQGSDDSSDSDEDHDVSQSPANRAAPTSLIRPLLSGTQTTSTGALTSTNADDHDVLQGSSSSSAVQAYSQLTSSKSGRGSGGGVLNANLGHSNFGADAAGYSSSKQTTVSLGVSASGTEPLMLSKSAKSLMNSGSHKQLPQPSSSGPAVESPNHLQNSAKSVLSSSNTSSKGQKKPGPPVSGLNSAKNTMDFSSNTKQQLSLSRAPAKPNLSMNYRSGSANITGSMMGSVNRSSGGVQGAAASALSSYRPGSLSSGYGMSSSANNNIGTTSGGTTSKLGSLLGSSKKTTSGGLGLTGTMDLSGSGFPEDGWSLGVVL